MTENLSGLLAISR